MILGEKTSIYQKTYRDYLARISEMDFPRTAKMLGLLLEKEGLVIPLFRAPFRVTKKDISGPSSKQPSFEISVVLSKYLSLCPERTPEGDEWTAYRDFPDARPLTNFFANEVEKAIVLAYSGGVKQLEKAAKALGGRSPDIELSYTLSMKIMALPGIPLLLLFNEEDREFQATCSVLFERRADRYLDCESLAILGRLLFVFLQDSAQEPVSPF